MGKKSYSAMIREQETVRDLMSSDVKEIVVAAKRLANNAIKLGGLGFGTSVLEWVASFSAIYLLVLDRTNWRTNILTSLLIPYISFSLPSVIFNLFRGDVGKSIALVAVILRLFFPRRFPGYACSGVHIALAFMTRLFFPRRFPDWLEMPGALILLIVVAPGLIAVTLRNSWIGLAICLGIACYLLQEHIRASGGFRNSFTKAEGISNSVGIVLLFVFPAWGLLTEIF